MISALALLVAAAHAEEPTTYDRLFGDVPAPAVTEQAPAPDEPDLGLTTLVTPIGFGIAGIGVALWLKRSATRKGPNGEVLAIVGRVAAGEKSSLLVVEVEDADGDRRRILLGCGGGTTTFLADLGIRAGSAAFDPTPVFVESADLAESPEELAAARVTATFLGADPRPASPAPPPPRTEPSGSASTGRGAPPLRNVAEEIIAERLSSAPSTSRGYA